jgi:hypothetical protein
MLAATLALTFAAAPLAAQSAGTATDKTPAKAADQAVMAKQGEMKEMHMPKECEMSPEMKAKHDAAMAKQDGMMHADMAKKGEMTEMKASEMAEKKDADMKHEAMDKKETMEHDKMMPKGAMTDEKCMEAMHKAEQKGEMMHHMPDATPNKAAMTEKKPDPTAGKKPR